MKPFSQWTKEDVEEEFGLCADRKHAGLQEWLSVSPSLSENECSTLRDYRPIRSIYLSRFL